MATQPSNIPVLPAPRDLTAADFFACLEALQVDVGQAFPKWTDFNRASPGNVLLQAFCYVLDILTKYQNDQARETFWATVQRRRNALALARGDGIAFKGNAAATVDVEFTLAAAIANDVVIPAGTKVLTSGLDDTFEFFTVAELRIPAGQTQGTVSARNSRIRIEQLSSDGTGSQAFRTTFIPFVQGTTIVTIAAEDWVRVENFFNSGPTDKHYTTVVDEDERLTVVTGNGVNGALPPLGPVTVQYQTGGGVNGNVAANTITVIGAGITDLAGNLVNISVTNPNAAAGGADRETIEQARRRIPGTLRALTRTVSREDFELVALLVPGVARSIMLTPDEDPSVGDNAGELVIVPEGGGVPSATLKASVLAKVTVDFPTILTFAVSVEDPSFLSIDVTADVKVKNGFTQAAVEQTIKDDLAAFFALVTAAGAPNPEVDFGANLVDNVVPFSDIFNVVRDAAGVERVKKSTFVPADNVAVALREFPQLGTVTVNFL